MSDERAEPQGASGAAAWWLLAGIAAATVVWIGLGSGNETSARAVGLEMSAPPTPQKVASDVERRTNVGSANSIATVAATVTSKSVDLRGSCSGGAFFRAFKDERTEAHFVECDGGSRSVRHQAYTTDYFTDLMADVTRYLLQRLGIDDPHGAPRAISTTRSKAVIKFHQPVDGASVRSLKSVTLLRGGQPKLRYYRQQGSARRRNSESPGAVSPRE